MIENPLDLDAWTPYRFAALANAVGIRLRAHYATRHDLTPPAWRCLAIIGKFQPLTPKDLAARSTMDRVQVSRALRQLAEMQFILRREDQADRRRVILRLSAKGEEAYDFIIPQARAIEDDLLATLSTTERHALSAILDKLEAQARLGLCDENLQVTR